MVLQAIYSFTDPAEFFPQDHEGIRSRRKRLGRALPKNIRSTRHDQIQDYLKDVVGKVTEQELMELQKIGL